MPAATWMECRSLRFSVEKWSGALAIIFLVHFMGNSPAAFFATVGCSLGEGSGDVTGLGGNGESLSTRRSVGAG